MLTHDLLESAFERDTPPFENACGNTIKRCHLCGKWRSVRALVKKQLMVSEKGLPRTSHLYFCKKCEEELWPCKSGS